MAIYRHRFLRHSAVLALALVLVCLLAHDAKSTEAPLPFDLREELVYEGEFTRALLRGIDIADLRFNVSPDNTSTVQEAAGASAPARLHFTVEAVSKGILRKLFGINFRQHIESTVDASSFSVLQTTKLDEQGSRRRTSEAVFDSSRGKVVWTERDPNEPQRPPRVVSADYRGTVQDLASIFYFLRTQKLELGRSFEITVSDSGRIYTVPIRVTEKKKMKSVLGEAVALKVEPEVFGEGRLLRGKGRVTIWFTDDARHIPIRAYISNEMGSLDIKLKSMKSGAKS